MFSMIPFPYKLLAGLALFAGVFFFGYMRGSAAGKAEVAAFAQKATQRANDLEKKNNEISNKVQVKYVDRVNTIKEKQYVYVDTAKNVVPRQHDLSNGFVYTHDISATNGNADPTRAADASPSGVADNQALATVVTNYSICQQTKEQLIALQQWIRENQAAIDEVNKKKGKRK